MSSPSIPKSCRAVVIEKANAPWAIKEVPMREPKEGEVLIKVSACGVCHSDSFVQNGSFGTYPRIPGHEVIGTVVAIGPNERKWKVGDKVGGPWHGGHDGLCTPCNKGLYQMCENEEINGVTRDGGYSEYCILRTEATVRIPKDADPAEYAPLLCAGVTVFNGIRKMNITHGDIVAIQGLGGLGHLAVQYARKMGYRTVALSTSSSKKDFAFQLGATDYVDTSKEDAAEALQKMGGASLIVVTAPNPKIMGPLINGCGPLGKVLILAPVGDIPVNTAALIPKGISVHGWPSGHALDSEEAIKFAEHQGVKCMIEKFPFDKVEDAVKHMESGKVRFRSVIVMD
ncbi:alcohol dehydrogenase [Aaosphaeria arxii CBS 175.79]|uniref:Alcohol dehydrogenase n=1 Tax=Aaosphaeria arxii CBS 175.79 TaxID=1450172 RepID=A0A6A5XPX3_9PLEO|nr:alcohol dehydrogenase [Aaosphaeria arxii CBS 175.79]KAF2014770.1 alcohol dehydrogenase [Aaosphaeria arxii CBS 175.79]